MLPKLLIVFVFLLVGCSTSYRSAPTTSVATNHAASLEITVKSPSETSHCGATAVGKHVLLTARHCLDDLRSLKIEGKPAKVLLETDDTNDHSLIVVDATFTVYVHLSIINLRMGDSIYIFGNPGEFSDLMRKGYVAGILPPRKGRDFDSVAYDFNGFFGDSGSAVFDKDGQIAGVVSYMVGGDIDHIQWKIMAGNPINFTVEQLKIIDEYGK